MSNMFILQLNHHERNGNFIFYILGSQRTCMIQNEIQQQQNGCNVKLLTKYICNYIFFIVSLKSALDSRCIYSVNFYNI